MVALALAACTKSAPTSADTANAAATDASAAAADANAAANSAATAANDAVLSARASNAAAEASAAGGGAIAPEKDGSGAAPPAEGPPPSPPSTAPPTQSASPGNLDGWPVYYNAPATLPLGAATPFRVIIASAHPVTTVDFKGAPGEVKSHPVAAPGIKIVKAVMSGPPGAVLIQPVSLACQAVGTATNPTWDWSVTPKITQPLVLTVDLYEVTLCDQVAPAVARIDTFTIPVTATWWARVVYYSSPTQKVLTAIFALIAAAGAAFGAWKWLWPLLKRQG